MSGKESESNSQLPPKKKGLPRLIAATKFSLAGLKAALQYEEAFRLEVFLFCILTPTGLWLGQSPVEQVLLIGSLFVVLLMELINSAIEATIDKSGTEFHILAERAKDIGSALVFVALLLVVFTWSMVLF